MFFPIRVSDNEPTLRSLSSCSINIILMPFFDQSQKNIAVKKYFSRMSIQNNAVSVFNEIYFKNTFSDNA